MAGDEADGAFEIVTELDVESGVHPSGAGTWFGEAFDSVESVRLEALEIEWWEDDRMLEVSAEGEESAIAAVFDHVLESGEAGGG